MNPSDYIRYVAGMDAEELKKEQKELEKKMELVKTVLSMKLSDENIVESAEKTIAQSVITPNDIKYGLLRFPTNSSISQALNKGSIITIEYKGLSFECSVPKLEKYPNQKGRINGLKKVYDQFKEFAENRTVIAELDEERYTIKILEVK
ncbi:hypothetical protein ACRQV7_00800 [Caproiciproducens sp. R2]|uniref:hypothetical protein n=1 Tax=Caproiciproducens sp. R2 TaxID=3435187 RepID=UPI0040333DA5